MDDDELRRWAKAWAERYPTAYDAVIAPLHGATVLDRAGVRTVAHWKFDSMAHRRANALTGLAGEEDQAIRDITAAARACLHDGAAMRMIRVLDGVGPALGSALLMTMDPQRWTVIDVRAVKSVGAIGYTEVPEDSQDQSTWIPYLLACRDVRDRTGMSLREVDRALYQANGDARLPDRLG